MVGVKQIKSIQYWSSHIHFVSDRIENASLRRCYFVYFKSLSKVTLKKLGSKTWNGANCKWMYCRKSLDMEVKARTKGSEEDPKARILVFPHLAHTSHGIKQLEGVGLVDKNGAHFCSWSRNIDLSSVDGPDEYTWMFRRTRWCLNR